MSPAARRSRERHLSLPVFPLSQPADGGRHLHTARFTGFVCQTGRTELAEALRDPERGIRILVPTSPSVAALFGGGGGGSERVRRCVVRLLSDTFPLRQAHCTSGLLPPPRACLWMPGGGRAAASVTWMWGGTRVSDPAWWSAFAAEEETLHCEPEFSRKRSLTES